jgi:hypothetical protein
MLEQDEEALRASKSGWRMMADDKPAPRTRTKKRRRPPPHDDHARYIIAIEDWDWGYSFGLAGLKDSPDPYMEHRHLTITGRLIHPTGLKIESVELSTLPNPDLDEHRRREHTPRAVGSLGAHDGRLDGLLSIPQDALTPVLQMLIAGRFKFVDMGGTKLRYRHALVKSFSLKTHPDEDDIPAAGEAT